MRFGNVIAWLLVAVLLAGLCAGCGAPEAATEENQSAETAETAPETAAPQEPQEQVDYMAIYAPVMDETVDLIRNGFDGEKDYHYASNGVIEAAMWGEPNETLQTVGYSLRDINGDGIPELFIGYVPDPVEKEPNELFGGYSCRNGELTMFVEGWARSRFVWMGENRFLHSGSSGAAHSAFGVFHLSEDGEEIVWVDFYFTDDVPPKTVDITSESYVPTDAPWFFHNQSGSWEQADSEEIKIQEEDFWKIYADLEAATVPMDMTPFALYEPTMQTSEEAVRVDYLDDVSSELGTVVEQAYSFFPELYPEDAKFDTTVVFRSAEHLTDFRLLALEFSDIDADGSAIFSATEVFRRPEFGGVPFLVPMNFPGDIPSNGFSYTEADGTVKTFSISVSGKDGSLVIQPIKIQ
ncbi:MAG: hypothetical protein Q3977_05120 [Oscillospiraceae bacterium]|nr:hypothetical protein [Oscillospiraceae bacterium]